MDPEKTKKRYKLTSTILVILALASLFTFFRFLAPVLFGVSMIFRMASRQKKVISLLDIKNPLSISTLIFAIIGIITLPIVAIYYDRYFIPVIAVWFAGFAILWLILGFIMVKGLDASKRR